MVVWLSVPIFIISLVITLNQGLGGSDTGGAQFLLLLAGGLVLLLYATVLRRSMSRAGFLVTCVVVLGGLGLLFGSISRGEEAEGVTAGLLIGAGVGLLGLAVRTGPPGIGSGSIQSSALLAPREAGHRTSEEKEILQLARRQSGEVRIGDVALHTSLSLDEARTVLDQLADRHFCEKKRLPGGTVVYRFPDFIPQ